MKTIEVKTEKGMIPVPCYEVEGCKGLVVTSTVFGRFEVTHSKSGGLIIGGYERAVNAACLMIELYLGLKEAGINPDLDMEEFQKHVISSDVKCKILGNMTIIQHINLIKPIMSFSGEFPWEGDDESPFTRLEELKAILSEQ